MHVFLSYFHELRNQKLRMFLTIMAVAWGMANIALMLSVGEGLYQTFTRSMKGVGEDIIVVWPGQSSIAYNGFGTGRPARVSDADIAKLATLPQVSSISGEYSGWNTKLIVGDKTVSRLTRGVYPSYGDLRNLTPEKGGRFIDKLDQDRRRRVIFIGNEVRDDLFGKDADAIGRVITVNGTPFTVIGVMKKKFQTSMYNGSDASGCFVPSETFRSLFNRPYVNVFVVKPRTAAESKATQEAIRSMLASRFGFHPDDTEVISSWDTVEMSRMTGLVMRGIQIFFGIMGALTLFIAGIGVANIMYVTVKERTREIGIKMAVGAHPALIILQFLLEAVFTVTIGGILGVCMALAMIKVTGYIPMPEDFIKEMGRPDPIFNGTVALASVTVLNIIGLFTGVFPARRASLVDPVEALRYE